MLEAPNMLLIGSGGKNSGKTAFACSVIEKFRERRDVMAAKVTVIRGGERACPRGGEGCGVCTSLEGDYCLTEERIAGSEKDTHRLLDAGARSVYWLRVLSEHLEEGAAELLERIGGDVPLVCESNSLRNGVSPGLFLMLRHADSQEMKASARAVLDYADRLVLTDGRAFDFEPGSIELVDGQWAMHHPASAIILAGGMNRRMGVDKSMMPIGDRPLIACVHAQLAPHFDQVLVSADDASKYEFLGVDVVRDEEPGQGPLMGIASALAASRNELNFVVACDMPRIDVGAMRRLLRAARDADAAVPARGGSYIEPLFAVYGKRILASMKEALAEGKRKVRDVLDRCDVKYVDLGDAEWLDNLNTREDYERYMANRA